MAASVQSSGGSLRDGRRVAVVAGLRTPFAKQGTALRSLSALDLGKIVCAELLERVDLDPSEVEEVVYGQVVPSIAAPNIAREIVLGTGMPRTIEAYSVSRACATSYQSTINVAQSIATGVIDCGLAGGADSASDVPIPVSKPLQEALLAASKAKTIGERLRAFRGLRPADLLPEPPGLGEPSTGETMGEAAERMAKLNGIPREAQDDFAHRSHTLAARAWAEGKFAGEVMAVHIPPRFEETFARDNLVREDSKLESYAKLRPVFDRKRGSVTAGNSSPLTDGASALLLMAEEKAKPLGLPVLGTIRSFAFVAVDPADQLLIGPVYATPIALERAGVTLADMALIDLHEAFAAQVLSVLQWFEKEGVGRVDREKLNVNGGSIAIGHPFAATGARQITQTLRELGRRGGGLALASACAAGGLAAAVVLDVAP